MGSGRRGGLELGDARRTRRLIRLVEDLAAPPRESLPVASGGGAETKAAYRLLDHSALEWQEILEGHTARPGERMAGPAVGLCIQDSTELDFTTPPGIAGLGRLSDAAQHGRYGHPPLVVTPPGVALGVIDAWRWARAPQGAGQGKESTRWLEGYGIVADLAAATPATRLGYGADREGDIRALRDEAASRGTPADWLIRARHERNPAVGDKLWAGLGTSEPVGEIAFTLPAAPGRPSRQGRQSLSLQRVALPVRPGAPPVSVTALLARAEHPPAGEKAIEGRWRTNRPAVPLEEAVELSEGDRRRWLVEIVFRILKSGGRVEALQLGTVERLERALVIYRIIAWRILPAVPWGRDCPLSCEVVFAAEEGPAAGIVAQRGPPPEMPPRLSERGRLIAGFGGVLGRQSEGHPGPKALWLGLPRVRAFALGIAVAQQVFIPTG